jgi:DNA-binding response OmpR family regulator
MTTSWQPTPKLSLLLVDDDEELCSMMREFFAEIGHNLDCAHNGRAGLARALGGTYDLVILDVMLPLVNGFTVLQQLRRRKDVPVIMLTARAQREDRIAGLNTGAKAFRSRRASRANSSRAAPHGQIVRLRHPQELRKHRG